MEFFTFLLAFITAIAIITVGFIIGTYVYFKLEDLYYYVRRRLSVKKSR